MTGKLNSWHLTGQVPSPCGATCYHPINYGNQLMTWILAVSGDLVDKRYCILQIICERKKKEKEKERKRKRKKKKRGLK
jgi:hypothetical protein